MLFSLSGSADGRLTKKLSESTTAAISHHTMSSMQMEARGRGGGRRFALTKLVGDQGCCQISSSCERINLGYLTEKSLKAAQGRTLMTMHDQRFLPLAVGASTSLWGRTSMTTHDQRLLHLVVGTSSLVFADSLGGVGSCLQ